MPALRRGGCAMTSRPARFALLAALVLPAGTAWGLMPSSQTATPPKSA